MLKNKEKRLITIVSTVFLSYGGSDEARTRYLIVANDALSQVSYRPSDIYNKARSIIFPIKKLKNIGQRRLFFPHHSPMMLA